MTKAAVKNIITTKPPIDVVYFSSDLYLKE